jgi:arylsulfatase A-like enzyme/Flp pilus assembly protein TadD
VTRRRAAALALGAVVLLAAGLRLRARHNAPPNLLLVTIDTLRADHVGAYGYAPASTPALDGIARRGARFEHAESAVPLTGPSHATILTGLYPPVHGVRDNVVFRMSPRATTLAELLRRRGYRTAAFVGAYPVAADFGFGLGFDHYGQRFHQSTTFGGGAERPANEVADEAVAWLADKPRAPFFLWVHFYDPHAPYAPPEPYRSTFADRPYDGEIAFADAQLARVLQALADSGHDGDTLVAALSDHGEGLGEHDEATHAVLIYESTLRVPWVMAGPGVQAGTVVADRVGTIDLMPTLLDLLGQPLPTGLLGRSLRPALEGRRLPPQPLYAESLFGRLNCRWAALRGWTDGDWKLVSAGEDELYDLSRDGGERRDVAAQEPERVKKMRDALQAAVARMAPAGDTARPVAISPEQEERLRSLGYASGGTGGGALDLPGLPSPRALAPLYDRLQVVLMAPPRGLPAAVAEAASLAERDPGNPFAHYVVASLAYRGGQLQLADRAFARTLDLDPDRPGMRSHYGRLLREMGRLADSERQLRIAVEQTTADDASTRLNLAETLAAAGKQAEAEAIIAPLLARDPNDTEAQRAMGRLLMARSRTEEALPHLERAAAGNDPEPWIELAAARLALGRPVEAREAAGRALQLNANHPWALAVTGQALAVEGRRDEALTVLKRALAVQPRRPEVWLSLARAFEAAGDTADAELCRRRAKAAGQGARP